MARLVLYCIGIVLFVLTSCTPAAVREAQATIAMADSLRAEGVSLSDSAALAEAVSSLCPWRYLYRDDYARANYYYGRYLRSVGNQPAAMQCFIDATHSHSHDYEILGRVYANMGNMCQEAEQYDLAYDIYQSSATTYLCASDTLMYYYGVCNMTWQLVSMLNPDIDYHSQKDSIELHKEIHSLLSSIEGYNDVHIHSRARQIHAMYAYNIGQYHTTLHNLKGMDGIYENALRAIAYLKLHNDSAFVYAHRVLAQTNQPNYRSSMLYVLSRDTLHLTRSQILDITSQRADQHKIIENEIASLSQAIQLLRIDLQHKPSLISFIIIAILIIISLIGYIQQKRGELLIFQRQHIIKENTKITEQNNNLFKQREEKIRHNCEVFRNSTNLKSVLCWNDYDSMCDNVDKQFYLLATKLKRRGILKEKEVRLCILVFLDISYKDMADILPYAESGIGKFKYSTAKKIGVETKNLRTYLVDLAVAL